MCWYISELVCIEGNIFSTVFHVFNGTWILLFVPGSYNQHFHTFYKPFSNSIPETEGGMDSIFATVNMTCRSQDSNPQPDYTYGALLYELFRLINRAEVLTVFQGYSFRYYYTTRCH